MASQTTVRLLADCVDEGTFTLEGFLVKTADGLVATYEIKRDAMTFYNKNASDVMTVPAPLLIVTNNRAFDRVYRESLSLVRMFRLQRVVDVTGVSGTGHVLDTVVFGDPDADVACVSFFHGERPSGTRRDSFAEERRIRCHGGHSAFEEEMNKELFIVRDPEPFFSDVQRQPWSDAS